LNRWQSCRDIFTGGVVERLIAPVLKIEFKILDSNGQIWTGLLWPVDLSFQTVLHFGQQWTEVSAIFFSGLLLRVTRRKMLHRHVRLEKIRL